VKITRKAEAVIAALLTESIHVAAAPKAGVGESIVRGGSRTWPSRLTNRPPPDTQVRLCATFRVGTLAGRTTS